MPLPKDCQRLRIYLGEEDRSGDQPLYECIVMTARKLGLAGATVLRGCLGYGHSSHIHTAKILRLSKDLPLVVEIVETREKLDALLARLDGALTSGLVTLEKVEVLRYGPGGQDDGDDKIL